MLYFDKSKKPNICIVNKSTIDIDNFSEMVDALRKYNDFYLSPVWGCSANIVESSTILKGYWALVFLDNQNDAIVKSYTDYTKEGLPVSHIYIKNNMIKKDNISVIASHELAEMLINPGMNLCSVKSSSNIIYSLDVCDAVENTDFLVDGFKMSNFVYPSWFENFRITGSCKFDQLGMIDKPFKIMKGGRMSLLTQKGKWMNIYGPNSLEKDFKLKDQRSSRHVRRYKSVFTNDSCEKTSLWNRFCGLFSW